MNQDQQLSADGFLVLPGLFSGRECSAFVEDIAGSLGNDSADAIESGQGRVVGGRNLIDHWAGWKRICSHPVLREFIRTHLGPHAGLVRILFFDKPPGHGWSLSMHRDRTIAVGQHQDPPDPFSKPTVKAGIPHVEANEALLRRMLTLRLHLDPMHDDNGPLMVIPGSHDEASRDDAEIQTIHCEAGDVFVMRPLLSHGSRSASKTAIDHRRVVHLEFSPEQDLPRGYRWHRFEAI